MKPSKPERCWITEDGEKIVVPPEAPHVGEYMPPGGEYGFNTPHDGWNFSHIRVHVETDRILLEAGSLASCERMLQATAWQLGDRSIIADIHCPTPESPAKVHAYERIGKNKWLLLTQVQESPSVVHPL